MHLFTLRAQRRFIINDRSGRPSGQAFVVFHGEDIAAAARDALDEQKFGDRTVRAKLTNKGELYAMHRACGLLPSTVALTRGLHRRVCRRYRATSRPPQQSGRGPPLLDLAVHVKGLPFVVDDEELRALFRGLPVRVCRCDCKWLRAGIGCRFSPLAALGFCRCMRVCVWCVCGWVCGCLCVRSVSSTPWMSVAVGPATLLWSSTPRKPHKRRCQRTGSMSAHGMWSCFWRTRTTSTASWHAMPNAWRRAVTVT